MAGTYSSLQVCAGCAVHALTQPSNMPVLVTDEADTAIGPLVFIFYSTTAFHHILSQLSLRFLSQPLSFSLLPVHPLLVVLSRIPHDLLAAAVFHFIPTKSETGVPGHTHEAVLSAAAWRPFTISKTALL